MEDTRQFGEIHETEVFHFWGSTDQTGYCRLKGNIVVCEFGGLPSHGHVLGWQALTPFTRPLPEPAILVVLDGRRAIPN
jgi:hypothetical protein